MIILLCKCSPLGIFTDLPKAILWMDENHPEAEMIRNTRTVIEWKVPRRGGRHVRYFARKKLVPVIE